MRRLPALAFASALVAGCQADALGGPPLPPEERDMAAPASLTGEYRVAAIDGVEIGGGIGLALTVTDKLIWFDPRCAGFTWTYTLLHGKLNTDRAQKPRPPGGSLVAGANAATCRIAVHPEQQRLATALDNVTSAWRTPSNGIKLTGGGHSVTLYSQ